MIVGAVRETYPGDRRVALTPYVVPLLAKSKCEVLVEHDAGAAAGFPDGAYSEKGARIAADRRAVFAAADVIVQIRAWGANPERGRDDLALLRPGQLLVGFFDPLNAADAVRRVATGRVSLVAMELVPRSTRAQTMDALSSMATIAGYRAALVAAEHLPKMFPMLITAAGTSTAAKVLVLGAGVAGLQAIATARRLGGLVEAYDVRRAAEDEVRSVGAKFVDLGLELPQAEGAGGYARALGEEFGRRQRELLAPIVAQRDVVISTAAVPGSKAPILITAGAVAEMRPGSVIVDLAAEQGGNCEVTRPGEIVQHGGATVVGLVNAAAGAPFDASQMYARNATALLQHLIRDGALRLDPADEITAATLVTRDGEVCHPAVRERLGPVATGVGAKE